MIVFFSCITLLYLILISALIYGFDKVYSFSLTNNSSKLKFSIIIPFRNEAENLQNLLDSIFNLEYEKHRFEIIFVDDDSTDSSKKIIERFMDNNALDLQIINNVRQSNSPKKDAITTAINKAKNEWIITTDADCVLPKFWLDAFSVFIDKTKAEFVVAPVTYYQVDSFFKRFQLLDFLSLQGATIGGFGIQKPFLCNGANLAYKKSLFKDLNGFNGNSNIASGDDIFMLEKALKNKSVRTGYLKHMHATVVTKAQNSFSQLVSQRIRWAAKSTQYQSVFAKLVGFIVLLMNAALVCMFVFAIAKVFSFKMLFYLLVIKVSIDFLLLYKTARFFNQESQLSSYFFSSLLYPFFSVFIACMSVFTTYKWKGRRFTK